MQPDRPPPSPPPADAALLLQAVAVPLLHLDATGRVSWANEAAVNLLGLLPGEDFSANWSDPAAARRLLGGIAASADLQRTNEPSGAFRADCRPLAGAGWMLTLQPLQELHALQAASADLNDLLDLARGFGRLGVWERSVDTLQGHWDPATLQFWGMDPDHPTPDFDEATQNIVELDRAALRQQFKKSLQRAGRYSARYRLQAQDGTLRRMHSQWLVKNGGDGKPERVLGLLVDDSEPYALAQSANELESQLALAVDLGGIAVWRQDLGSGRMHYSAQGWRSLGLEPVPEGLTLEQVRALIHPQDLPRVMASAQAALRSSQPVDVEARYMHSDGKWRHHMLRRMVLRDSAGQPTAFLGVALDMSERLEERRRAEETARRLDTVTRVAGIGHWVFQTGKEFAEWSAPLRTIFGVPDDAPVPLMREWLQRHVHSDDQALVKRSLQQWSQTGGSGLELSFRALRRDGSPLQLLTHSVVEAGPEGPLLFGMVIDITERSRSERALEIAQKRAALAAHGAGLGTWEIELASGESHWDDAMWRLRGLTPAATGMSYERRLACVHPDDRDRVDKQMQELHPSGHTAEREFRVVWPDGQVR